MEKLENFEMDLNTRSINESVDTFSNIILETAKSSLPNQRRRKRRRKSYKVWYDIDCEHLRRTVKNLGKKLHKQPRNNPLREAFFREKKRYKKLIKRKRHLFKDQCIRKLEEMIASDPKEYWDTLKRLKNECSEHKDTAEYISLDEWKDHFQGIYDKPTVTNDFLKESLEQEEKIPCFSALDFKITEQEVRNALGKLKRRKSPRYDLIIGEMLRIGTDTLLTPLTKLFNKIFVSKQYPDEWNRGIIVPIHKKGSKLDPNNYRGITLNSVLAKTYSIVLCSRLESFLLENNIIYETQIGFKKKAQIADHIFVLQALVEKYANKKKLYMCFIDFEKAYDSVWREALLYKLLKNGVRGLFYSQIKAMLNNVKVCVRQNNKISDFFASNKGVKQGEVLSPLLFNLFINDINDVLDEGCDPTSLDGKTIPCLQYADDLVLVSQSKEGLQRCLDNIHSYCQKWMLKVNTGKSKVMIMSKHQSKIKDTWYMGGRELESVENYKYLGVNISRSGSFTICKKELTEKARKSMNKLKCLLWDSRIKKSVALKLFDQLVSPILLYGAEIWAALDTTKLLRLNETSTLEDLYDKLPQEKINIHFCKFLLGVSSKSTNNAVMAELGRYPISILAITRMIAYYARATHQEGNSLVGAALREMKGQANMGHVSWIRAAQNVVECLGLDLEQISANMASSSYLKKKTCTRIKTILMNRYNEYWKTQMNKQGGKLDSYRVFKDKFEYEDYLDVINNDKHRIAMSRLRISNHRLQVEVGRYKRPLVPRHDRICEFCQDGVEDEAHFLFQCPTYRTPRGEILGQESMIGDSQLLLKDLFVRGNICPLADVARYIYEAMILRQDTLETANGMDTNGQGIT
jgi:hypothetical protein